MTSSMPQDQTQTGQNSAGGQGLFDLQGIMDDTFGYEPDADDTAGIAAKNTFKYFIWKGIFSEEANILHFPCARLSLSKFFSNISSRADLRRLSAWDGLRSITTFNLIS